MLTHHSGPDHHHHARSETIRNFKIRFENCMKQFRESVEARANESGYRGGWRDALAGGALSVTTVAGGTIVTFLATINAITAAASAGASIAVAAVGIAAAGGYNVYRTRREKQECKRALNLLQCDDFDAQVATIAARLANIYHYQLENCSPNDAEELANACFKALRNEMKTNKHLKFRDLLSSSHLQALIVKSASVVRKHPLSINGHDDQKANTRGALSHAGLYCEETGQFYRCEASKPTKYGVLFFATRHELENYKLQIEKIKHDESRWHYEKMPAAQVKLLMRNDLFHKHAKKDDTYISVDDSDIESSAEEKSSCSLTM